ncbi:MAG: isopentenyl-diphosphate Delta-isomerase [Candidatus Micrarchaeia archaeon]
MSSGNEHQLVVLVDENDNQVGTADKLEAHMHGGKLHRAFSIFVFNSKGETLLQKRAMGKYHSAGKWSNTCCSHPLVGESVIEAAHRRLKEEMGFDCDLAEQFHFIYKTDVGNGLTEWEYDHVLFGRYDGEPILNSEEASDYKYVSLEELRSSIASAPDQYTPWLRICINQVIDAYQKLNG